MRRMIKERYEALLIRLAAWLLDRGVQRSAVISRKDNNWLFDVYFELVDIAKRIENGYSKS